MSMPLTDCQQCRDHRQVPPLAGRSGTARCKAAEPTVKQLLENHHRGGTAGKTLSAPQPIAPGHCYSHLCSCRSFQLLNLSTALQEAEFPHPWCCHTGEHGEVTLPPPGDPNTKPIFPLFHLKPMSLQCPQPTEP